MDTLVNVLAIFEPEYFGLWVAQSLARHLKCVPHKFGVEEGRGPSLIGHDGWSPVNLSGLAGSAWQFPWIYSI